MFNDMSPTIWKMPQSAPTEDAIFSGWQKTKSGKSLALYTITALGHPSLGSTVTDVTLLKLR